MTQPRKDGIPQPTDWTRQIALLPSSAFCLTDIDLVVHRHYPRKVQLLMLIEQKAYNAAVGFAQRDTLSIVNQLLNMSNGRPVWTGRNECAKALYMGLHVLTFSGRTPLQSQQIFWDDEPVSLDTLVGILRFDYDPNSFKRGAS